MDKNGPVEILGLTLEETGGWVSGLGLAPYRARQIRRWAFKTLAQSFEEMTELPRDVRGLLEERASLSPLRLLEMKRARDGTRKFLFGLCDGPSIETVLIPERGHWTVCVSSQAGCAMGCQFCLTARRGLKRNLTSAEIVAQVVEVRRHLEDPGSLTNVVFMGMGEPLANYEAVLRAVGNLISEEALNFSHRKVTLSTCGLVPKMAQLGRESSINLAISLNAADDETRSRLMPINRTYPLEHLLLAARQYPLAPTRRITFEYVLIRGENDTARDASSLIELLRGIRSKVNLIPLNPHHGSPFKAPSERSVLRFQEILISHHLTAIVRKSKGQEIGAACGMLTGGAGGA